MKSVPSRSMSCGSCVWGAAARTRGRKGERDDILEKPARPLSNERARVNVRRTIFPAPRNKPTKTRRSAVEARGTEIRLVRSGTRHRGGAGTRLSSGRPVRLHLALAIEDH